MTDTIEAIVEAIRSAFAGVPRGAITLHEAQVIDGYGDDDERARARRLDTETSWMQIPGAHIEQCPNALPYLDLVSWRYYIAAFMVWSLQNFRTNASIASDFTIYCFLSGWEERFRMLDSDQSHCVCRFLRYMAASDYADSDAARQALEQTWGRFCE